MNKKKIQHGGVRQGAGRKLGSGLYGEPTKIIRVPKSKVESIKDYLLHKTFESNVYDFQQPALNADQQKLILFNHKVPAGFPSPADDHAEKRLDLNEYLIDKQETTFFVRVKGDSMVDAGILDNDIVIVDRSKQARLGAIVLASIDGEFTVKTLSKKKEIPVLLPANKNYQPIEVKETSQFEIWGVVTGSVRKF
ncbi:MAG: translesion error-prone DNA polymerase V autoproteolytic subunit [Nitrosomonadales bacterium]|jgi:DNA polymerase V